MNMSIIVCTIRIHPGKRTVRSSLLRGYNVCCLVFNNDVYICLGVRKLHVCAFSVTWSNKAGRPVGRTAFFNKNILKGVSHTYRLHTFNNLNASKAYLYRFAINKTKNLFQHRDK